MYFRNIIVELAVSTRMPDVTTIEEEYEYPGWLVFNGLFKTSVHGQNDITPQDIVDSFSEYSQGSPNDPESGFDVMELSSKLQQMSELNEATAEFA